MCVYFHEFRRIFMKYMQICANACIFYKYGVSSKHFFGNVFKKRTFLRFLSILVIFCDFTTWYITAD